MKTLFTLIFAFIVTTQSSAQLIQASVTKGTTPNRIKILLKANVDQVAGINSISTLQFTVSVDTIGVPLAPQIKIIPLPSFPATALQWDTTFYFENNHWNYNLILNNTPIAPVATANTPYEVMEVEFSGFPLLKSTVGLISYIDGGAETQQGYFFCDGTVKSDGMGNLYFQNPTNSAIITNSNSYDAVNSVPGTGISSALLANITLPVKFTGFTAIKKDNSAVLNWQVENETALTDRYEVERSLNGIDFKKISTIAPKNNGRSANSYTSTDAGLATVHSGVIYYRVKQTDKDGQFIYTEIKSVRVDSKSFSASVYPNPVQRNANLTIDLTENSTVSISLNDANGKSIKTIQMQGLKGINKKEIDMSGLSRGNYLLRVQTTTETTTLNIVKGNN